MSDDKDLRDSETGRFLKGRKGGPGRPQGSRSKLTETFFVDLYGKWQEKGPAAIDAMIAEKPTDFVKCVASLMPREFNLKDNPLSDMTENELADLIALVKSAIVSGPGAKAAGSSGTGTEEETRH